MPKQDDDGDKVHSRKKIDERSLKKMAPQQKSRYLAYEPPPKEIQDTQANCKKRLRDEKKKYEEKNAPLTEEECMDKDKHERLIGQLKAAEARNRLRIMRLRYQSNRAQEISHLIACQPTALKAVRLQALVPSYPDTKDKGDTLDKLDRELVEDLLEDSKGLLTNRIH